MLFFFFLSSKSFGVGVRTSCFPKVVQGGKNERGSREVLSSTRHAGAAYAEVSFKKIQQRKYCILQQTSHNIEILKVGDTALYAVLPR